CRGPTPEGSRPGFPAGPTPLSGLLQVGVRFLPHPVPASLRRAWRLAVPRGRPLREDDGLTPFLVWTGAGSVVPLDRWHVVCAGGTLSPRTWPPALWPALISILSSTTLTVFPPALQLG